MPLGHFDQAALNLWRQVRDQQRAMQGIREPVDAPPPQHLEEVVVNAFDLFVDKPLPVKYVKPRKEE